MKVKNLCGQQDVAASAYAIDDYVIDDKLGGEQAFDQLRHRCLQRGLDLACDVVTNHTGIESAWLREHPDWFVQLPYPPYPGYRFTGPDLSSSPDYSIQIEDGYYDHSEAAVVCRYQQRQTGDVRYIYHGNDGTHLPWNDTVQLNYLLPDMREAMIQLIIRVARRFRIIRFDAAMTLAKRHFQRLWYPLPGVAGGVPSRSDHALSQQDFNHYFPVEFWRELVDRVQLEAPDTLLVAEAFWLMEGYFVRTLGMHRVYNSAFMNMLMQEENAKYRQTIKNILVFDPAILQRFVNFMSNPDEEPAIEQFGDGDKYFCVATMLATMPGLPMFGHGQIEGLREKYGMEYLAPRWDEPVDQPLLERHRLSIFPLLRQRALFSGAEAFQLYDFESVYGVEEDVFVYTNQLGERRVLVICNNSDKSIAGRVGAPVAMAGRAGRDLVSACAIDCNSDFVVLSDLTDNVQYLQPAASLRQGGDFTLAPYSARVIGSFAPHQDEDGRWQRLWQQYGDRGVRHLWLEYDGLLLEESWPLLSDLLALPQPPLVDVDTDTGSVAYHPDGTAQITIPASDPGDVTITRVVTCTAGLPAAVTLHLSTGPEYAMANVGNRLYRATIPAADLTGNATLDVAATCNGHTVTTAIGSITLYEPIGSIIDALTGQPVEGATVTLYQVPGWVPRTGPDDLGPNTCESYHSKPAGAPWSQPAPTHLGIIANADVTPTAPRLPYQQTTVAGYYGWGVSEGCWYITVEAGGYEPLVSPVVGAPPEVVGLDLILIPRRYHVYLPLVLRDYVRYFDGPWEIEPNNSWQEANGPLISGRDYYGYPNDARDYFSIYTRQAGEITVNLTGHTGQGVQLQLFYQGIDNRVGYQIVSGGQATIGHIGPAGWYYAYIYTAGGYNNDTPYTLQITYPE